MNNLQKPFYYIDKCIHILIVDDNKEVIAFVENLMSVMQVYSIHTAQSTHEAMAILQSPGRIHLCVMDLGITDCHGDEFFLIKQFGCVLPFIVFTASTSPRAGFLAHSHGAYDVIEKSNPFDSLTFAKIANAAALRSIINPKYGISTSNDSLKQATDTLFEHSPRFVAEWAQHLGITDRALRYIWTKNLGANAKIIVALYQIFMTAFTYFESVFGNVHQDSINSAVQNPHYRRLEEFFHIHKSTINDFINYGNIAAVIR